MTIGVIGTHPSVSQTAAIIAAGGHRVVILGAECAQDVGHQRCVGSLTELCEGARTIVSSFDGDASLIDATLSSKGLAAALGPGGTHVTLGLHAGETISAVATAHASTGTQFVAAPILLIDHQGSGPTAVVGGSKTAVAALEPIFQLLHIRALDAGENPVTASMLALIHSALVGCAIQAMAEAFSLVRKYGVDPLVMYDVITDGLFGGSAVYKSNGLRMIEVEHAGDHVTVSGALQILDLVMQAADRARVPMPALDACRDRVIGALAHGDGDQNWTILSREQARASGLD